MHPNLVRCQILASVIAADGIIHDAEKAFLNHLMSRLKLSPQEQAEVMGLKYAAEAEEAVAAMSVSEKRMILDEAVAAVLVDGKLSPEEKEIVDHLSTVMGFKDS